MSNPTELPDLDRQFRKKPVVIEAIQWTGKLACLDAFNIPELHQSLGSNMVGIPTLEGTMIARVGDWIIKGVKGEFYPCKPDIFAATYEPAARRAQPEGESAACKGCNGHGMVGNILDTDVCPFCQGSGQESAPVPAAQPAESGKEEMADRIRKLEAIVLGSCEDLGALHNAFGFDPADPIDTDRMICWVSDWRAQQAAEAKKDARPAGYLTPSQFERLALGRVAEILPVESGGKGKTAVYFAAQLDGGQEGSAS